MNLKAAVALIFSSFCFCFSTAETIDPRTFDYSRADSIALSNNRQFYYTKYLAEKLTANLSTEHEKFRALFRWVADNIAYNIAQRNAEPEYVLRKRQAICAGYARILKELCDLSGIECKIIGGYAKVSEERDIGKLEKTDHDWNAVKLYDKWYLADVTWAAGNVLRGRFTKEFDELYFLTDPGIFIYSHLPEDPEWTLTEKKFSVKDFGNMPVYKPDFFNLEITALSKIDGEVGNRLQYKFKSDTKVTRISYYFASERKFHEIDFKSENDINEFDIRFNTYPTGELLIYVNDKCILGFKKK